MKARLLLCVVVCVMVSAPAVAGEPEAEQKSRNACQMGGAWFGENALGPWTALVVENSRQQGTVVVEWAGGTGDFYGICPGAVAISNGLAVWERTGPRSFEFTGVSFSIDAESNVVCTWKNSGWGELDRGCETGWLNGTLEFFVADANPFEDEPYYSIPATGDSPFVVMTVDPPVE